MANPNIGLLIYKFKCNTLSAKEGKVLEAWVAESSANKLFFDQALDNDELLQQYIEKRRIIGLSDKKYVWKRMLAEGIVSKPKIFWLSGWRKYSIAATLLIGLTLVWYIVFRPAAPSVADIVKNDTITNIVPGS